jgi:uncharacterized small protein (TIGR04563 family)
MRKGKTKQSIYLPEEQSIWIDEQCERLDRSRSWIFQIALKVAKERIDSMEAPPHSIHSKQQGGTLNESPMQDAASRYTINDDSFTMDDCWGATACAMVMPYGNLPSDFLKRYETALFRRDLKAAKGLEVQLRRAARKRDLGY